MPDAKIILNTFKSNVLEKHRVHDIDNIKISNLKNEVTWINVTSISDEQTVRQIGQKFGLHHLVIEDILNTDQRPKVDDYEKYLFIIVKAVDYNENPSEDDESSITTKQLSLVLFKNFLLSFQESESNTFENIIVRLREGARDRKTGADDLLYSICDIIVDNYFSVVEIIGEDIDDLEDKVLLDPSEELLPEIYSVKKDLIYLRKVLWHMRNAFGNIYKRDNPMINEKTVYYFRDIYDHILQMIDLSETYREICSGMLDTYLSSISNKTNDVMKILTIYSTIFIPLTFLSGVYGMNFKYFPELDWKYSYALFWLTSIAVTIYMLRFFKKRKWL